MVGDCVYSSRGDRMGTTHFFGRPLADFMNLRKQVHEEIVFTGNIGAIVADTPAYDQAVRSLRRLGAKVQATAATDSRLLRWFLIYRGYDLRKAGGGLVGLSNSLHAPGRRSRRPNELG